MKIKLKVEQVTNIQTRSLLYSAAPGHTTSATVFNFFILLNIITSPIPTTAQLKFLCKFDHLWCLQPVISIQESLSVVIIEHESILNPLVFES